MLTRATGCPKVSQLVTELEFLSHCKLAIAQAAYETTDKKEARRLISWAKVIDKEISAASSRHS